MLLFQRLYDLTHEVFEAFVINDDNEVVTEEIMSPFVHCRHNSM